MIYVNKDTINVEIPKSGNTGEPRQIRLLNLLTNIDIYAEIEDLGNDPIVYIFNIESIVKDLVVGLYDYFVLDANGSVLDNGILQYDSFNSEVGAYSLDDPKMIQYSLGGAYTPIPETIFTIFEDGVYDTTGIDKVIVKTQDDEPVDYPNYLVFTNTSQVTINNNLKSAPNLEYSFDRDNWVTIEFPQDTSILDIATDDKPIYFRGDNPDGFDNNTLGNKFLTFVSDGEVGGNIMSILDPTCESVTLPNNDYCFGRLFYGSRITSAAGLILPADLLVSNAYYLLFSNCNNLTQAPELPATKLAMQCYMYMFANCKSLTKAPVLPAATLAPYCYQYMFKGCITLVNPPELPAMNLAERCYAEMFEDCTALRTVPNLPATTLAPYCYQGMFSGCVCLTSDDLPELPLLTLADGCYQGMFSDCIGLTTTPELPAKIATGSCYRYMFKGCTSLTQAPALPATTVEDSCYEGMFSGCIGLSTAPALPATTLTPYCYASMFEGCTALTAAPELPATTLASYCYQKMFFGCTSLTKSPSKLAATAAPSYCCQLMFQGCAALNTTPELPATKLNWLSYDSMFRDCTSLTTAPDLPATTLATLCYASMFNGCTALTKVPLILPATTAPSYCYSNMFYGCKSLTKAPELPATTLATECYYSMFYNCSNLAKAPELPATTLATSCYEFMFHNCTSLTTAPELPATTLTTSCYEGMFSGCSKIAYITCLATDISASSALTGWTYGVASTGTFYIAAGVEWPTGTSGIPTGWTVIDPSYIPPYLRFGCSDKNSTATIKVPTVSLYPDLQYRLVTDNIEGEWLRLTKNTTYTISGNYLYMEFRGNNPHGINTNSVYMQFVTTGNAFISGNIMSLCDNGDHDNVLNNLNSYAFYYMFGSTASTGTLDASGLHLPYCGNVYCYGNLFRGNTALTVAPKELPAKQLTKQCYLGMFYNCTNLVTGPEVIAATTVADQSFRIMFSGCSKLKSTPQFEIEVLEGANNCYNMFYNCSSLTDVNITLPADTLTSYCYRGMFNGCALISQAPELPADTLVSYCYQYLFNGCSRLTSITCLAKNPSEISNALTNWTTNISTTGTFYKSAGVEWPTGTAGIPTGWSVAEL